MECKKLVEDNFSNFDLKRLEDLFVEKLNMENEL